jgi:hypothetical protein
MSEEIQEGEFKDISDGVASALEEITPDSDMIAPILWDKVKTISDMKIILNTIFGGINKTNPFIEEAKPFLGEFVNKYEFQEAENKNLKKKIKV